MLRPCLEQLARERGLFVPNPPAKEEAMPTHQNVLPVRVGCDKSGFQFFFHQPTPGIEHLAVLFPTEVSSFDFQVENSGRTVQYKLDAQSLRLFGLAQ